MNATLVAWVESIYLGAPGLATLTVLLIAFLLGAAIGIERGISTSSVGIRTCTLVALASAAFATLIVKRVPESGWGHGFGAVATGVGFLGAREFVTGLFVTLLVLAVNFLLRPVAAWIDRHRAMRKPEDDVLNG